LTNIIIKTILWPIFPLQKVLVYVQPLLRKLTDGQGTKWRRNIAENFNRLSRVHERYRQTGDRQTDGRAIR